MNKNYKQKEPNKGSFCFAKGVDSMDTVNVIGVCRQISIEAQAIQTCTNSLETNTDKTLNSILEEIRQDGLEHLQKLTIALTALLNGEELADAENMDDAQKPEDVVGGVNGESPKIAEEVG